MKNQYICPECNTPGSFHGRSCLNCDHCPELDKGVESSTVMEAKPENGIETRGGREPTDRYPFDDEFWM